MNVLIATDGKLDPVTCAETAARLASDDGQVTVMTVVEVPRRLLTDLRHVYGERTEAAPIDQSVEFAAHETAHDHISASWPGDDAMLERYVNDRAGERTAALVAALHERGVSPEVRAVDSEEVVAEILREADSQSADFICVGTHGQGMFEGLLGSTSTKIIRRAQCGVILIRS